MHKKISKILLILAGSFVWSLIMVRSGLKYDFGYGFWGANGHDGIWHIALAESLSRGSFQNPVFSGFNLQNYHLGFDLFLALINRLTMIPISYLYFQILPPVFALLIGFLTYKFVLIWKKSKKFAWWSTFFVYFNGSLGFLVTFFREKILSGESMFWSQQSFSTLVNPPFALSLIFILLGLIFLQKYQKLHSTYYMLLATLFFSLLIFIKVYAGLLVLGALFVVAIHTFLKNRKRIFFKVFVLVLAISFLLFLPFVDFKQSQLVWQPFWFLETLMSYSDRLGWDRFYSAMTTYRMGYLWVKAILAYGLAFIIFLIGNMGLRVISINYLVRVINKKEKSDSIALFIFSICLGAVVVPMFFVQSGTPWNTIQFFYYFLFFTSILAGLSFSRIFEKSKLFIKQALILLVVVFTLASIWSTLQHYLPIFPQAKISTEEIEALSFLSNQPDGVVLTYPFDANKAKEAQSNPPRPLYFYDSTAYVSAYSKKQTFLEDEVNLNIMGYDWKQRKKELLEFISNLDPEKGDQFFIKNDIRYLYLVKQNSPLMGEYLRLGGADLGLRKIFENEKVIIYSYGEDFCCS